MLSEKINSVPANLVQLSLCVANNVTSLISGLQTAWLVFTHRNFGQHSLSLNLPWVPWDLRPAEPSSASRDV